MTWIDFVIIGVIFISCFISLIRGFVREALSLTGWIVSFLIAWRLHGSFSTILHDSISNLNLRLIVAFLGRKDKRTRVGFFRLLALAGALGGLFVLAATAHQGGELVYQHGLGVMVSEELEP